MPPVAARTALLLPLLLILLQGGGAGVAAFGCGGDTVQCASLSAIFAATGGQGWANSSGWGGGDPCAPAWAGVVCGAAAGVATAVRRLSLAANNLTGSLPAAITDLSALVSLCVSGGGGGGDRPQDCPPFGGEAGAAWRRPRAPPSAHRPRPAAQERG